MPISSQLIALFASGNLTRVDEYLDKNPDSFKEKDLLGRAVRHGNLELVKHLYSRGARDVQPALFYIIYGNKRDIAEFLIEKGADMMMEDDYGPIPLCI